MTKPLMTVEEAAELMCCSPRTVRQYIYDGDLVAGNIGRAIVVKSADCLALADKIMIEQTAKRLTLLKAKKARKAAEAEA